MGIETHVQKSEGLQKGCMELWSALRDVTESATFEQRFCECLMRWRMWDEDWAGKIHRYFKDLTCLSPDLRYKSEKPFWKVIKKGAEEGVEVGDIFVENFDREQFYSDMESKTFVPYQDR